MSRRAILVIAAMVAALVACTGAVFAQETERRVKPPSASQQTPESDVIPGRYIVVLEDEDSGRSAAEASSDRRQARQVAEDLSQGNKVEDVSQTYGAALKGFAAEIPAGKLGAVRSDPRVAFVAEDREVHASAQTLPFGVDRVDADLDTTSVDAGNGSGAVNADIAILDSGIYNKHPPSPSPAARTARGMARTPSQTTTGTAATWPGPPRPRTTRQKLSARRRGRACGRSRCSRPTGRAAGPTSYAASTGKRRTPAPLRRPT